MLWSLMLIIVHKQNRMDFTLDFLSYMDIDLYLHLNTDPYQ